jgi:LysM repeat protein
VRFGVRRPDILALNPALRKNPNSLRIGQKVLLPAGTDITKKAERRASSALPANAKRPAGSTVYVVKSGDVLSTIANKHGVTVAAIKGANNLKNDTIWVGQKLTIPGATKKPVEKKAAPAKKATPAKKEAAKPAPAPIVTPKDEPVQAKPEMPPAPVVEEAPAPVVEDVMEELPAQDGEEAILPPAPEAPAAAPAPVQSERVHVVKEGEDLLSIAMRWQVPPAELRALNGLTDVADPKLAPGTTLRLPMPAAQ